MWDSTDTKSPFLKSRVPGPASTTVPQNSCPKLEGTGKRSGAQLFQL